MRRLKFSVLNKLDQIGKPPGAFRDDDARMIRLPGRVPQNIKFKIGRFALVALLEPGQTRTHDFLCDSQCRLWILRVTARPEFALDLKT